MNNLKLTLSAAILSAAVFAFANAAHAQATRTWISGLGDNVNPCSRTAPCKTFAGAISKTARGGEINAIDPGGYGTINITKSITIDGTGTMTSILGSGVNGIVTNITDPTDVGVVRIRNLALNGAGATTTGAGTGKTGISIIAANKVSIENIVIDNFTDGIISTAKTSQVFVKDSSIRNCSGAGINAAAGQIALSNVSVLFNGTGLITATGGTIVSFKNNAVFGNKKDGEPNSTAVLR